MSTIKATITGISNYIPDFILDNFKLEKMVNTSNEWILERTGIKTRHILKREDLGSAYMGSQAAQKLLEKTNTNPKHIDAILCATVTPDYLFPATANLIASNIEAVNSFGYDVEAACCSFIYALQTGACLIESGRYQKILVIGTDKMSSIVDYTDRTVCVLFGDAAGAVLLEPTHNENYIIDSFFRSDGLGKDYLYMPAGGSVNPPNLETVRKGEHNIFQNGRIVFKNAVNRMKQSVDQIMKKNKLNKNNIAYLVPHQANFRIIQTTAKFMELPIEKVMINIQKYGNTTSATIPLCLCDYESQLKKGDNLILVAFGGGFTSGGIYLKWGY